MMNVMYPAFFSVDKISYDTFSSTLKGKDRRLTTRKKKANEMHSVVLIYSLQILICIEWHSVLPSELL